ncbi:uncharacterized protein LOC114523277 [Dendronephthya gigantea]|uniref:uncharacterized protein LOC114523277 n=1 Tax=Dendronephthya gigantea TaxID=151771 RepID=UPI00106ACB42|nr:uncharacterized protein LOC114523277 [Dendronephthya gigantea]
MKRYEKNPKKHDGKNRVKINKRDDVTLLKDHTTTGSKRTPAAVAAVLGNEKVQEAVIEKGVEVVGDAIDQQLANIQGAHNKSEAFLNKRIKLNVFPEKGWRNEDMFLPPGYHMDAEIESDSSPASSKEVGDPVYTYPAGIGTMIMNGCWGTGYQPGDPCYQSLEVLTACQNMIDGAAFIGVGFDGRGKYSPESRKMSIIQRSCGGRLYYDDFQVPDTMSVHGIYETSSHMKIFSSRKEYQTYLQTEAGISGSFFGLYAGAKAAYGASSSSNSQNNLAIFDIDVDRYEIFKDEVKPQDLSRAFLHEFMNLPPSFIQPGAPAKFSDFISRWGTHYIKSAKFGGQLEIRKLQSGLSRSSKQEFAVEAEVEYKGLFASAGAYSSTRIGAEAKTEEKFMSTSVQALGGSQKIAAAVADVYSPTFKNTLVEWLDSINSYPKAFKFIMGSITDLVDFRAADLFPDATVNWGCEANSAALGRERNTGRYYYNRTVDNAIIKAYCEYESREDLENKLKQRRTSLKAAIESYMEEGPVSATERNLPAGDGGCETLNLEDSLAIPTWDEISNDSHVFRVIFDMDVDLWGNSSNIPKTMSRLMKRIRNRWITGDENGEFHLFNAFSNGGSGTLSNSKISIFGLVLTYSDGVLTLAEEDYSESGEYFSNLDERFRFYTFGNGEDDVAIVDIKVTPRSGFVQECKGGTELDAEGLLCVKKPCHEACDAIEGCRQSTGDTPLPSECFSCKYAQDGDNCILTCPSGMSPNKNKRCTDSYDLTYKGSSFDDLDRSFPLPYTFPSFTISVWLKLPVYQEKYLNHLFKVFGYTYLTSQLDAYYVLELSVRYKTAEQPSIMADFYDWVLGSISPSNRIELQPLEAPENTGWIYLSIARDSSSGNMQLLKYGRTLVSASKIILPGQTMMKTGLFILGGISSQVSWSGGAPNYNLPMTVSQLNIWNHVLTNEKMVAMARRNLCDGPAGNSIDWQDFKAALNLTRFTMNEPSECSTISG